MQDPALHMCNTCRAHADGRRSYLGAVPVPGRVSRGVAAALATLKSGMSPHQRVPTSHMPDQPHLWAGMKPFRKVESLLKSLSEREWGGSLPSLFSAARLQRGVAMGFWPATYRALGKPSGGSQSPPQRPFE